MGLETPRIPETTRAPLRAPVKLLLFKGCFGQPGPCQTPGILAAQASIFGLGFRGTNGSGRWNRIFEGSGLALAV